MIKVGIVGGTGYTGVELLRILKNHNKVEVIAITSRSEKGTKVVDMFPNLRGFYDDLEFSEPHIDNLKDCAVVFFATPHGVAQAMAEELLTNNIKIIDLSADFRLDDISLWEKWYNAEHKAKDLQSVSVYGLPELNREEIKNKNLIANPGCYPTSVQLGFAPLLMRNLIDTKSLIADCKSGITGAGRAAKINLLYCESAENVNAYGVLAHRHHPEIVQQLSKLTNEEIVLTFTPHLMPMSRGIHSTLYASLTTDISADALQKIFEDFYRDEYFIDVLPKGEFPNTKTVKGTNFVRISVNKSPYSNQVVVLVVIDNLGKGASSQAVQNMNILFGLKENYALNNIAIMP